MFELNPSPNIKEEIVDGYKVYIIDDFYQDPDSVYEYIMSHEAELWKMDEEPTHNNIFFEDKKIHLETEEVSKVYSFLKQLCGGEIGYDDEVDVNVTRFKKNKFNNYGKNYWVPHQDVGYNAVIYFNKEEHGCGTNLYELLDPDNEPPGDDHGGEHYYPWRPKEKYKVLKTLEPKYNRMVAFNGFETFHGMNICDSVFFDEIYRVTQVFFLLDKSVNREEELD